MSSFNVKVLPRSCQPDSLSQLMRPLKWGTAWSSIIRDIRNKSSQTFSYSSLLYKVDIFWYFWLWYVVNLMPLEVKPHTVPHFKDLNSGKDIHSWQGYGCTFICIRLLWKVPILLHTEQIGRVFIGASVLTLPTKAILRLPFPASTFVKLELLHNWRAVYRKLGM